MYVRDLKEGILIKPTGRWEWRVAPLQKHDNGPAVAELRHEGIKHYSAVTYTPPHKHNRKQTAAVYVGKRKLSNYYYGVKTQHILLIDGILAVMAGYSFRDVEKI